MQVEIRRVDWPFRSRFRIAYKTSTQAETVQVQLTDGRLAGRGESMEVRMAACVLASLLAQAPPPTSEHQAQVPAADTVAPAS